MSDTETTKSRREELITAVEKVGVSEAVRRIASVVQETTDKPPGLWRYALSDLFRAIAASALRRAMILEGCDMFDLRVYRTYRLPVFSYRWNKQSFPELEPSAIEDLERSERIQRREGCANAN